MLEIRCFGPLRLTSKGLPKALAALPRTAPLLAYLLLHRDQAIDRGRLASILWPDVREEESKANLRRHLHELQGALPPAPDDRPWLLRLSGALRWNPEADFWLDVAAFDELLATPGQLPAAMALYTGDLLPDVDEDWVVIERERYHRMAVAGLRQLLESAEGRPEAELREFADRLFQLEPLNEEAVRLVMTTRANAGDRAGALSAFHELRRRLAEWLGIGPVAETEALANAITLGTFPGRSRAPSPAGQSSPNAAGTPASPSPSPPASSPRSATEPSMTAAAPMASPSHATAGGPAPSDGLTAPARPTDNGRRARPRSNLPAAVTSFVGRQAELAEIVRRLTDANEPARLITISGPGGTGKTRLAREVAGQVLPQAGEIFPDGVWEVDLAAQTDPELVPTAIADVLGVVTDARRSPLDSLVGVLAPMRLLIVLDNFEQVADAAPAVGRLLAAAPGVRILATSRSALGLYGEQELPLAPLGLLPAESSAAVGEALTLFVQRVQAVNPAFRLTDENGPAVAEICARLDGLPLAIELAAGYGRLFSPAALLDRLTELPFFSGELPRGASHRPVRHQTLRQTMDWSFRLLDEQEQALFCRLAVFAGSFALAAAEAVATTAEASAGDLFDGLASLVAKSMLVPAPALADGLPRFMMLGTLREYGLSRLGEREELAQLRARHAAYFGASAEAAAAGLRGHKPGPWFLQMDADHDDYRAALAFLIETDQAEAGLNLANRLEPHWAARGHLDEARRWLRQLLALPSAAPTVTRVNALRMAARMASRQGDQADARLSSEEAVAISRALGNDVEVARSLLTTAANARSPEAARVMLEESLTLFREAGDQAGVAGVFQTLGVKAYFAQDYLAARAHLEQSLTIRRAIGEHSHIDQLLNNLGLVAYALDDLPAALELHEEALAMRRAADSKPSVAQSLINLAVVLAHMGRGEEAEALLLEALPITWEIGSKIAIIESVEWLAVLAAGSHRPERAITLFGAASALREQLQITLDPVFQAEQSSLLQASRDALEPAAAAAAWAAGRALSLEGAVKAGLEAAP